ncbi:MAG: hypothetical protein HY007_00760 [Candidatus Sungbacteria bacterium]|nr:hypothetical protein [Candidatus Sungbacteria bacterium]
MNFKKFFQSKLFTKIFAGIGIVIAALLIFQAGMFVGYRKAAFSYRWGQDYYHTFGGRRKNFLAGMDRGEFPSAHGTIGKIIKIDLPTFVIEGQDKTEQVVLTNDQTTVRRFRETIKPADLKPDDYVVVIGDPNDTSQIEARLIRLMPFPPAAMMGTGTPMTR